MKFHDKNAGSNTDNPDHQHHKMENFDKVLLNDNEKEDDKIKTNVFETTFNITKLFLGISILASPHAFSEGGIVGGIVGFAFAGALNILTVTMQSDAATAIGGNIASYSELGRAVYGLYGKIFIDVFIIIAQSGL